MIGHRLGTLLTSDIIRTANAAGNLFSNQATSNCLRHEPAASASPSDMGHHITCCIS